MIRVLIADDHELVREGLSRVLKRAGGIEVVAVADDAAGAIAAVREHPVDAIIMDLNMPGRSGIDAIAPLQAIRPGLPVLILSFNDDSDIGVRVMRAGGAGFVSKQSAAEEAVDALRCVVAGDRYVSPQLAAQLAAALAAPDDAPRHESLSERERVVMQRIASGHTTRQIAEELALSINTIATYRRRIREKLDIRTDNELIRYALRHGIEA